MIDVIVTEGVDELIDEVLCRRLYVILKCKVKKKLGFFWLFIIELKPGILKEEVKHCQFNLIEPVNQLRRNDVFQVFDDIFREGVLVRHEGHDVEDYTQFDWLFIKKIRRRLPIIIALAFQQSFD